MKKTFRSEKELKKYGVTNKERKVLELFNVNGNKGLSFKTVFGDDFYTLSQIYDWFSSLRIVKALAEMNAAMDVYDGYVDGALMAIIQNYSGNVPEKTRVQAISEYNKVRNRVKTAIDLHSQTSLDISKISDADLENLVVQLMNKDKDE